MQLDIRLDGYQVTLQVNPTKPSAMEKLRQALWEEDEECWVEEEDTSQDTEKQAG